MTSKLIEQHIIVSSMWQYINNYNLLSRSQLGFCERLSSQLLDVVHRAAEAMVKRRALHLISFDFAKVSDKSKFVVKGVRTVN